MYLENNGRRWLSSPTKQTVGKPTIALYYLEVASEMLFESVNFEHRLVDEKPAYLEALIGLKDAF